MAARKQKNEARGRGPEPGPRYFEIVNWRKAQPTIPERDAPWCKLYTSLLDNDAFGALDDAARMLIVALWLYAAHSGRHVFPADPKWLWKKIPVLNQEPDLTPLLNARDAYGQPRPFVRYCEPNAAQEDPQKPKRAAKPRARKTEKTREEKREKKSRTLTGSEERKRKKNRASAPSMVSKPDESRPEQSESEPESTGQTTGQPLTPAAQQTRAESAKPANPQESEAGEARAHIVPLPPPSARGAAPQSLGAIVMQRFPEHWQDPEAEAFGWEIVAALGLPADRQNMVSRSNWGAFASWWCQVRARAPALGLGELRAVAIKQANYVRTKNRTARRPGAVWMTIMDGELRKRGITLPPARAGPTAAG